MLCSPPSSLSSIYGLQIYNLTNVFLSAYAIISFTGWHMSSLRSAWPVQFITKQLHDSTFDHWEQLRIEQMSCSGMQLLCYFSSFVRQEEYTTPAILITTCHPMRLYGFFTCSTVVIGGSSVAEKQKLHYSISVWLWLHRQVEEWLLIKET